MAIPSVLYKYVPFSVQSIENLKNQVIYFGSPLRFNDPYDCALFPSVNEPTDDEVERIRQHYLARPELTEKLRREFQHTPAAGLRIMLLQIAQGTLEDNINKFRSSHGVSCFAERPDNLLMWSHYAGHHKGFCLEFSTDAEPFEKLRQVRYSDTMPACDLVRILCDQNLDQLVDLFCTKSADWAYEREWRVIHTEAGTAYTYLPEALTGVYFGPEATITSLEIVALILAGQNERVKLWKGTRSKSDFSVQFEQVTYVPHLEARRLGLA